MIKRTVKLSLAFIMLGSAVFAQSINDAKKAIDAEQFQKAKSFLKNLAAAKPDAEASFFLGDVYLKTDYVDSARAAFTKGISADPKFPLNYVGLGAIDLSTNNGTSAKSNFDKAVSLAGKKDAKPFIYIARAYTKAQKPDFKIALQYLDKAKAANGKDAEVFLAQGDAYRGLMDQSNAFSAYRNAFDLDKSLLRAKVELGVITKQAKAFQEATDAFNSVIALNANYGPAYRELAETYYLWAQGKNDADYNAKIKQALQYYTKYMDLTDRSLESRMRFADFLILAREYKALEQESQEMSKLDKTNPRIFRYLGYSAYENQNYPASVQALKDFMAKVDPTRVIAQDYLYLGRAQLKAGQDSAGIATLRKAIELDSTNVEGMSEVGKLLYDSKKYAEAAAAYEASLTGSKPDLLDYYYLGSSYYWLFNTLKADKKNPDKEILVKADSAFSKLLARTPTTEQGWQFRGRINRLMDDEEDSQGLAFPFYEKYIETVTVSKPEKAAKNSAGLVEAYTYLGLVEAKKNKNNTKALDYFNKGLALAPGDANLLQAKKAVSSGN